MKNTAPGEIRNLHKKRQLDDFWASSPTGDEITLREKLSGKPPSKVISLIAEDFAARFGDVNKVGLDIQLFLKKDARYCGWGELDKRIQYAHRLMRQFQQTQAADYLDRLRNITFTLSNQLRPEDLPESKQRYKTPEEAARNFGTCHLCWRSVPRDPRGNRILYCHRHSYGEKPSRHPEHRRLAAIKRGDPKKGRMSIDDRVRELHAKVHLPIMRTKKSATERNTYYAHLCLELNGPLPHLARFLRDQGVIIPDCEAIGRALENATNIPYENLSDVNRAAWQFFFEVEMGWYLFLYWEKIFLAEAWLAGDAERRKNH